jgi:DNA repair exonuclease SbcCD ATPase subunit
MITLKKLKWNNCFSYGENNELDLDSCTVTQIVGTNGAGKSSLPLIIEEALYNKNSKGIKKVDIPNRYINEGYDIYLSWQKDADEYAITVNRKSGIKVKLEKNGVDISSHTATNTYKTVQEIIGVDFKTFSQLVYQSTNASLQFLTATDTNRKKFLIDLLHLEEYTLFFELFKELARTTTLAVKEIEGKLKTVEKWLVDNKLTDTTILPMLNLEIDTEDDEKKLRNLTKEIENISEKNSKITKNNQYKNLLKKINIEEIQNSDITEEESYDKLQKELGSFSAQMQSAKALITKMERLGSICPTCDQDIDTDRVATIIKEAALSIEKAKKSNEQITGKITRIKDRNATFRRNRKLQADWESLYRSIDNDLPTDPLDGKELKINLSIVQKRLAKARKDLANNAKENEARTRKNTRIQVIQEQTDAFLEDLRVCQEALKENSKLLSNFDLLKKAFSTNGLLAYKIENLVKELEVKTNEYLVELSDGRFSLEFVVTNDKLNVHITDNGNVVDILALSSGELARVNTSTLIAIRDLMNSISKSRINILFLDEVINVLDEVGREKLVEVLLNENLNTYIVSHFWTHPLLEKIEVVKPDNISKLEK